MLRVLTPVPVLARGFPLHPDDEKDPDVFRLDLSRFGMPTARVVFRRGDGVDTTAMHTDLGSHPVSLYKRHTAGSRFKKR
jgi:hypothetical protein